MKSRQSMVTLRLDLCMPRYLSELRETFILEMCMLRACILDICIDSKFRSLYNRTHMDIDWLKWFKYLPKRTPIWLVKGPKRAHSRRVMGATESHPVVPDGARVKKIYLHFEEGEDDKQHLTLKLTIPSKWTGATIERLKQVPTHR